MAYSIIQEPFRKNQNGQPMDYHYNFNHLTEELRQIFSIMSDVKQMQNQRNWMMVLT